MNNVDNFAVVPFREDMVREATDVHLHAYDGYLNTKLGPRYIAAFIRWFTTQEEAIARVVVNKQSELLGYLVGAPYGYKDKISKHLVLAATCGVLARPSLLLDARVHRQVFARLGFSGPLSHSQSEKLKLPGNIMSLVSICVRPDMQRRGIGNLLMDAFETECKARGSKSAILSVHKPNMAARHLYEKRGWVIHDSTNESFRYTWTPHVTGS